MLTENCVKIQHLSKIHQLPKSTFHGSRLTEIPKNKLRSSVDPEIQDSVHNNGDALFGEGVYTALENSAKNYAEIRKGSLFEIDITGKKFFDSRKINSLFEGENSAISKMLNSSSEKVRQKAQETIGELKIISEEFLHFLETKIAEIEIKPSLIPNRLNILKFIKKLNEINLENINSVDLKNILPINFGQKLTQTGGAFGKTNIEKESLYYFGEFLQDFGFDGLIATEIADWNSKTGKSGNNLTYVIFDPNNQGILAKKVE